MKLDLFDSSLNLMPEPTCQSQRIGPGTVLLRAFAAPEALQVLAAIQTLIEQAPLRHMCTPGGKTIAVAMSHCGTHTTVIPTVSRVYWLYTRCLFNQSLHTRCGHGLASRSG